MKKTLDKMDKKTKPGKPTKPVKRPEREHKPRPLDDDAMPPNNPFEGLAKAVLTRKGIK